MWKMMIEGIPAIWEANGRMGKIPSTTMFASGNLTKDEVVKKIPEAIRSKMVLLYTGEKSLEHEQLNELCDELIEAAKSLYTVLPSVIGLGEVLV